MSNSIFSQQQDVKIESVKEDKEVEKIEKLVFIADCDITDDLKAEFDKYERLVKFKREAFVNRDISYFSDKKIHYLYINIHEKQAKNWLSENLKQFSKYDYKAVLITGDSRKSDWISNIKEYISSVVKFKDIKDLNTLSLDELLNKVQRFHIKMPDSRCQKVFHCLFGSKKKEVL